MYGRSYNWGDLPESRLNDYTKQHNGKRRNICRGTFDIFNQKNGRFSAQFELVRLRSRHKTVFLGNIKTFEEKKTT